MAGDDLDDDYAPDDLVAPSDDEPAAEFTPLEGEEDAFVAEDGDSPEEPSGKIAPRSTNTEEDEAKKEKKRKRKAKDNERKAKKRRLTVSDPSNPGNAAFTASQPPEILASFLARGQDQVLNELTEVELNDIRIPASCIVDTREWKGERTVDTLPAFIRQVAPTLSTRIAQASKNNGAPTCIILAGSALRVTDLTRAIRPMRGDKGGEVAKLFARHFKLSEHAEHLKKTKVGVAIGTPARVGSLLSQTDSLNLKALSHVVLDVTFIDSKMRSMIDIPEVKQDLFKTFFTDATLRARFVEGKTTLILF